MKLLIVLTFVAVIVAAQALTDEQKAKWKKWSDDCQTETGVSKEAIQKLRNNEFDAVDDKLKAHSLCFAKKSGLASATGEINVEDVKTKLKRAGTNDEEIEKIVTKCTASHATPEETAFEVFKCIRENQAKFSPV